MIEKDRIQEDDERNIIQIKYRTCVALQQFLKGCVMGCRKQWELIKQENEDFKTEKGNIQRIQEKSYSLLFDCFLYAFCQNQVAIILNQLAGILNSQDLKALIRKYDSHFKPYKRIANGMKHLNREVKKLIETSARGNIQFYNFFGTEITFDDTRAECISEEPLKITESLYKRFEDILTIELENLNKRLIEINKK
ncbi:MAG: hypothetical protein ACTSQP_22175 [Promethearchaeota archaeon]